MQQSIRKYAFISYFYFIIKRLSFLDCHRLTYWFSFGMHYCKPLIHLVQLQEYQDFQSIGIWIKGILQ